MDAQSIYGSKNKTYAFITTVIVHAIILLLLFILNVSKPDPPLSADGGMVVNLGYVDESTGDIQPISDEVDVKPIITKEEIKASQAENEKYLTQSIEETEAIKSSEIAKENSNTNQANDNNITKEIQPEQQTPPQPQVNPVALYKGKKNNSSSQGTSDKGTGDQGNPNGDPFSNGNGNGPGSGTGTGQGTGPGGNGPGGKGISHTLLNRKAENLMKPEYECNEMGTVIVEIWVNQNGKVTKAKAGARGSTTASQCLYTKAENAAYKTKFNANPEAPEEQRGTIIYNFTLR
jgi:protein TonB